MCHRCSKLESICNPKREMKFTWLKISKFWPLLLVMLFFHMALRGVEWLQDVRHVLSFNYRGNTWFRITLIRFDANSRAWTSSFGAWHPCLFVFAFWVFFFLRATVPRKRPVSLGRVTVEWNLSLAFWDLAMQTRGRSEWGGERRECVFLFVPSSWCSQASLGFWSGFEAMGLELNGEVFHSDSHGLVWYAMELSDSDSDSKICHLGAWLPHIATPYPYP